MWKVLVLASLDGAGSEMVLVFDSGVTLVADAVKSLDPMLPEVCCSVPETEAKERMAEVGRKAERDAARRREEEERRAAIV